MEQRSAITNFQSYGNKRPMIGTGSILFFLALDFGQNLGGAAFDTAFMAVVLLAVGALTFFLTEGEFQFGSWILGRTGIALFGGVLGVLFNLSLGVVFPEVFSFLPFTLLILTTVIFCLLQFVNFFRFRFSN